MLKTNTEKLLDVLQRHEDPRMTAFNYDCAMDALKAHELKDRCEELEKQNKELKEWLEVALRVIPRSKPKIRGYIEAALQQNKGENE